MGAKVPPSPSVTSRVAGLVRAQADAGMEYLRDVAVTCAVRHRSGPMTIDATEDDVIVLTVVRDGEVYLPAFFEHYQRLGVRHFVFLDNRSTDATLRLVSLGSKVTALSCDLPFGRFKRSMRRYLVSHYGIRAWVFLVDIDEFFDFPHSDAISLSRFVCYLNRDGYSAVTTQMLDLCPREGAGCGEAAGLERHRFYDLSTMRKRSLAEDDLKRGTRCVRANPEIALHSGGSWQTLLDLKPLRTKHALMRPSQGVRPLDAHFVAGARVADVSAVLYHRKFATGFRDRVRAVAAGSHDAVSGRYWKDVARRVDGRDDIALPADRSTELTGVAQLVDEGFLVTTPKYDAFVRSAAATEDGWVASSVKY